MIRRVMVVDDDLPFLQNLQQYDWSSLGCVCVCSASNGQEALEKCSQFLPHIIITDINMPMINGIELARLIKEQYPQIQIILLTVHQDFAYAQKAITYGVNDYLIKDTQYKSMLPIVMERAIRNFSERENDHESFLLHSERFLVLDEKCMENTSELDLFFQRNNGFLMTLKMQKPFPARTEIFKYIDRNIATDIGWILCGSQYLEIIGSSKPETIRLLQEYRMHRLLQNEKEYVCVSNTQIKNATEYLSAHQTNVLTLEKTFYQTSSPVLFAQEGHFHALPGFFAQHLDQKIASVSTPEMLEALFHQMKLECQQNQYKPADLRTAGVQIVRQAEMRWAEETNSHIYEDIQSASNVDRFFDCIGQYVMQLFLKRSNISYQCSAAIEVMKANLADASLSLNSVAEQVFMSPGYLSKKMKEETGLSFREELTKLRMKRAAELLVDGKCKVYEIAEQTGYQNYRSFVSAFETYFGISPKKYRGNPA